MNMGLVLDTKPGKEIGMSKDMMLVRKEVAYQYICGGYVLLPCEKTRSLWTHNCCMIVHIILISEVLMVFMLRKTGSIILTCASLLFFSNKINNVIKLFCEMFSVIGTSDQR